MKIRSVLLIALCFFTTTACSGKEAEPVNDEAEMLSSDEDISKKENKEHAAIYERFLKDEEKVYIDCSADVGKHFFLKKEEGKELKLSEIIKAVFDACNSVDEFYVTCQGVEYAYIDCGKDGNEELVLNIGMRGASEWTESLIIKEYGGQLKTVYANNVTGDYIFSCIDITEYGYVISEEEIVSDESRIEYIDAEGKYNYICTKHEKREDCGSEPIIYNGDILDIAEDTDQFDKYTESTIKPDIYVIMHIDVNDTADDATDDIYCGSMNGHFFTHYYEGQNSLKHYIHDVNIDIAKPAMFKAAYRFRDYFDEKGLKLYTTKAVDEIISERENGAGLTEEIKDGTAARMYALDSTLFTDEDNYEVTEADYSLYDDLINRLKTEMKKDSFESVYDFAYERGLSHELYYYVYDSSGDKAGYLQEDIDGDGVDELLLGKNDPESSEYKKEWFDVWPDQIYDMFTIRDGKLLHVFKGWGRNRYYLCGDGIIANEGSGGAASNSHEIYRYSNGELQLIEGTDWEDGKGTYYESEGKTYDITNSDRDYEIEFFEKYPYKKIDYIPFIE